MKCTVCATKKAKRTCALNPPSVCSECCGQTRQEEICQSCSYWKPPIRKYAELPAYSTNDMQSESRQDVAAMLESAILITDLQTNRTMQDSQMLAFLEMLFDAYFFNEQPISSDHLVNTAYQSANQILQKNISPIHTQESLVKIIGALYFVAKRRTKGRREHLDFLHQFPIQVFPND